MGKKSKSVILSRSSVDRLNRKSLERLARSEALAKSVKDGGYSISDIQNWICSKICEAKSPEFVQKDGSCCYPWCPELITPSDGIAGVWKAICRGADGELYAVEFKLEKTDVTLEGTPKKIEPTSDYAYISEMEDEEVEAQRKDSTPLIYRYFEATADGSNDESRSLTLSFSSENPALQRCDESQTIARSAGIEAGAVYIEVLDHEPENVDLSMLNNRGAVLDEHDDKDQIGVVESATVNAAAKRAEAKITYDSSEKGKLRYRQAVDKIRPHISAGYKHTKHLGKFELPNGRVAHRFAFKPVEISSVAVPADPTIGYGRSYQDLPEIDSKTNTKSKDNEFKEKIMTEAEIQAEKDKQAEAIRSASVTAEAKARTAERERRKSFYDVRDGLVKQHPHCEVKIRAMVDEALCGDTSLGDLQIRALQEIINAKPAPQTTMASLGVSEKEKGKYSILRGIQNVLKRADRRDSELTPEANTFEGEMHLAIEKANRDSGSAVTPKGFWVPADAEMSPRSISRHDRGRIQRDMVAGIFGQGGASVPTELMLPYIEVLRNEMVCSRMGITTISGLQGNIVIPRQTAAALAYAVPEIGALTASNQILDQIALTPKRIGATNPYSKQLLLQSSLDVENFVRTDFFAVIGLLWDYYILNGQGGNSQPLGIMNTPGIGQIVLGGAETWANIVLMETTIAKFNARKMGRGYVTTSNSKGRLKTLAKLLVGATTVPATALWEDRGIEGDGMGEMNGYKAMDSQQVPNDQLIFGVWPTIIHAMWGGLDVVVDPYTKAGTGEVVITMNTYGDVAVRHPQEFCITADSAAQ